MNPPPDLDRREAARWLLLMALVGALLRLHRLDALPLWNDECIQWGGIELPMAELRAKHLFTIDHMPPLSYWIQRLFWLLSPTVFAVRFPGALAGVAMIPLAYRTLRPGLSRAVAAAAASFTALSFFLVFYSQECRAYIFFGLAIWLFLGDWLRMLLEPDGGPPRLPLLLRWLAAGLLCAAFHFNASLLFICVGLTTALVVAADAARGDGDLRGRLWRALGRGAPMAAVLLLALGATWLAMRYFLGPKMGHMMARARAKADLPDAALLARALLPITFGRGWRLIPFAALVALGWLAPTRLTRRAAFLAAALFAVSLAAGLWLFPRLGAWNISGGASRYYFWWAWCVTVALASGTERLALFAGARGGVRGFGIGGLIALIALLQPYRLYYRSDTKWFNVAAFRQSVEELGENRMLLLHNIYDMHQLALYWPTNATMAAPPMYNREDYEPLRIGAWLTEAVRRFPDAVFKTSWHRELDSELEKILCETYARRTRIEPDPAAKALASTGLLPIDLAACELFFNTDDDLAAMAESKALLRTDPAWPLLTTRNLEGEFEFWRVVDQPGRLRAISARALGNLELFAGQWRAESALQIWTPGADAARTTIPAAPAMFFDAAKGTAVRRWLDLNELRRMDGRVRVRLERQRCALPPLPPAGSLEIHLAADGAPVLLEQPRLRDGVSTFEPGSEADAANAGTAPAAGAR